MQNKKICEGRTNSFVIGARGKLERTKKKEEETSEQGHLWDSIVASNARN